MCSPSNELSCKKYLNWTLKLRDLKSLSEDKKIKQWGWPYVNFRLSRYHGLSILHQNIVVVSS
jgi:hypothetical protein